MIQFCFFFLCSWKTKQFYSNLTNILKKFIKKSKENSKNLKESSSTRSILKSSCSKIEKGTILQIDHEQHGHGYDQDDLIKDPKDIRNSTISKSVFWAYHNEFISEKFPINSTNPSNSDILSSEEPDEVSFFFFFFFFFFF